MWIIYLVEHSLTKELYVGITNNLRKRLVEHNQGRQSATRRKSGARLPVYAEVYRSRIDAVERERRLKHHGSAMRELRKRAHKSLLGV